MVTNIAAHGRHFTQSSIHSVAERHGGAAVLVRRIAGDRVVGGSAEVGLDLVDSLTCDVATYRGERTFNAAEARAYGFVDEVVQPLTHKPPDRDRHAEGCTLLRRAYYVRDQDWFKNSSTWARMPVCTTGSG